MARTIRIYHSESIATGNKVSLSPVASKHLIQVLRLKPSDLFNLFDGHGNEYKAQIIDANKNKLIAEIMEQIVPIPESNLKIHLGQDPLIN